MTQRDGQRLIVKEMIAFFCMLAAVGAAYNGKFVAAAGYLTIFLVIFYEKKVRRWLRQRRY